MDKFTIALGAGCGIGVVVPKIFEQYIEPIYGPYIPYLDMLGNWGRWSVFVPIVSGIALLGISQFTNIIKNDILNGMATMYGFTATIAGAVNGIFAPPVAAARMITSPAQQQALITQAAARPVARGATPTGITPKVILA